MKRRMGFGLLVIIVVLGFAYQMRIAAQKRNSFMNDDAIPQSANIGTVPQDVQTSAEHTVQAFLGDLQHQSYDQALTVTTSDFPTPHSADALKTLATRETFSVIFTRPLKFDPAYIGSHGQKMIMRASLVGGSKPYRTVCSFGKKNGAWLISGILDPVPSSKPPTSSSTGMLKAHG